MTNITQPLLIGKSYRNSFWVRLWQSLSGGSQHLFHDRNDAPQQLFFPKHITAPQPHIPGNIASFFRNNPKGYGEDSFKFEKIRHIVNKGKWLASMDETYRWGIASRKDGRFTYAIQGMISDTDCLVDRIGRIPVSGIVASLAPIDPITGGQLLVQSPDANSFNTAQLLYTASLWRFFPKAEAIHSPDNLQTQFVNQSQFCLI